MEDELKQTLHERRMAFMLMSALVEHRMHPLVALALLDAWPDLPSAL